MKRISTLLLALMTGLSAVMAERVQIGALFYDLRASDKTAAVTYQATTNNYPTLTSATVPATVTYQGVRYTVTSVSANAFAQCAALTSLRLPASVTEIGECAFYGCAALTGMTFPNGLTAIRRGAFRGCAALTQVIVPRGVSVLEDSTFADCAALRSVLVYGGLKTIEKQVFKNCAALASVSLPAGLTEIKKEAFFGCSSLTSINIPDGVTRIGGAAFANCTSLASVRLPNTVAEVAKEAFIGCTALTRPIYNSQLFVFMPASFNGYFTIPSGIHTICGGAFENCVGLRGVVIPESVMIIGSNAFIGCTSLPVVEHLRYAGTALVEVVDKNFSSYAIREGTRWIAKEVFYQCIEMTSVVIPASVASIGDAAFSECPRLEFIYNYALTPQRIDEDVFGEPEEEEEGEDSEEGEGGEEQHYGPVDKLTCKLYVPKSSVALYQGAPVWREFTHIFAIPSPQGLDGIGTGDGHGQKRLRDGRLLIEKKGKTYDMSGAEIR